jgi:hypothetical protein
MLISMAEEKHNETATITMTIMYIRQLSFCFISQHVLKTKRGVMVQTSKLNLETR